MGTDLPPVIANAPVLIAGLGLYLQAFWELSSCRGSGFSEGQIPWIAIERYATRFEFDPEQEMALFNHVRALDNVYLQHQAKKAKQANSSGKGTGIQAKTPNSRQPYRQEHKRRC